MTARGRKNRLGACRLAGAVHIPVRMDRFFPFVLLADSTKRWRDVCRDAAGEDSINRTPSLKESDAPIGGVALF